MTQKPKHIIAVLNSTQDVIELFQTLLEEEGFNVVGGLIPNIKRGRLSLVNFINDHNPDLIIYDLAPPYQENLAFLEIIKNMKVMEGRKFIYTTTNKEALSKIAGHDFKSVEIIGKPMDLMEMVEAVKKALKK